LNTVATRTPETILADSSVSSPTPHVTGAEIDMPRSPRLTCLPSCRQHFEPATIEAPGAYITMSTMLIAAHDAHARPDIPG
jgi:hypothetical protein